MKSKPIKFGWKIQCLCGNDGYPYHLDIYCRKFKDSGNKFGLDGKVALEMVNVLKDMKDDDITDWEFFLDYYFTSYKLNKKLSDDRHRNCKREQVSHPNVIKAYNEGMRGKNMMDRSLESYCPGTTKKKWLFLLFVNILNVSVIATCSPFHLQYCKLDSKMMYL